MRAILSAVALESRVRARFKQDILRHRTRYVQYTKHHNEANTQLLLHRHLKPPHQWLWQNQYRHIRKYIEHSGTDARGIG